jgi:LPS-assembly protein
MVVAYYRWLCVCLFLFPCCVGAKKSVESFPLDKPKNAQYFNTIANAKAGSLLGWVNAACTLNTCPGYYHVPALSYQTPFAMTNDIDQAPVDIQATSSEMQQFGRSVFYGKVILTQPNRQLSSDLAYVYTDKEGQIKQVNMLDNVHWRQPGVLLIGDVAYLFIRPTYKEIVMQHVLYRYSLNSSQGEKANKEQTAQDMHGVTAWGRAKEAHRSQQDEVHLDHVSYSTCPPSESICDWQWHAHSMVLNKTKGRGQAWHAVLKVKGVPMIYTPYISFPLDDRRQSGFLFPSVGYRSDSGAILNVPYYLNLAPNYDDVLTPSAIEKRGLQLSNTFRYLSQRSLASLYTSFLPHDSAFSDLQNQYASDYGASTSAVTQDELADLEGANLFRYALRYQQTTLFNQYWQANVDYSQVSDDYYLQDFSSELNEETSGQILQQAQVNYADEHWGLSALLQNYQTLHPVDQDLISNQYARLPELSMSASYPSLPLGLTFNWNTDFVYFWKEANPGASEVSTTGDRLDLGPSLSLPMQRAYGFFIPTAKLDLTAYSLSNPSEGDPEGPSRTLPILSVDSGLVFERDRAFLFPSYHQTLEPRLYYLFVPYKDQDDLPNFDTTLSTLSYDQLFQNNRFSSVDRMGDANQLSLGLTSRYLQRESGDDVLDLSVGDIIYFKDRDVNLCTTTECQLKNTQGYSSLVSQATYRWSSLWSFSVSDLYNVQNNKFENSTVGLRYRPSANHFLNLGYSYLNEGNIYSDTSSSIENLSQATASSEWLLNDRWNLLTELDVNLNKDHSYSYVFGLEYSSCCWSVRFLNQRELTGVENSINQYKNVYFLQFMLRGFGLINFAEADNVIKEKIPGYQDRFTKVY